MFPKYRQNRREKRLYPRKVRREITHLREKILANHTLDERLISKIH